VETNHIAKGEGGFSKTVVKAGHHIRPYSAEGRWSSNEKRSKKGGRGNRYPEGWGPNQSFNVVGGEKEDLRKKQRWLTVKHSMDRLEWGIILTCSKWRLTEHQELICSSVRTYPGGGETMAGSSVSRSSLRGKLGPRRGKVSGTTVGRKSKQKTRNTE